MRVSLGLLLVAGMLGGCVATSGGGSTDGEIVNNSNVPITQQTKDAAERVNVMMSEPAGPSRFKLTIGTRINSDRTLAERTNLGRSEELTREAIRIARANNATGFAVLNDHTLVRTQVRRIMQTSASEPNALVREWLIEVGNASVPRPDGKPWFTIPKS